MCFSFFYFYTLITIIELDVISNKANQDSLLVAIILKLLLDLSISYPFLTSLFYSELGKSMNSSIDQYLQAELLEKVFINFDYFVIKSVLLTLAISIELLNKLSKNVCNRF